MSESLGHDSRALANAILAIAGEKGMKLTLMQLLKLQFFAHGWSLAMHNTPLSKHFAEAWQYGPVFPLVYKAFPGSGSTPITQTIWDKITGVEFSEPLSQQEQALINDVLDGYGNVHAYTLSRMTHETGTPWDRTVKERGMYCPIPNEWIQEYLGLA